MKKAATIAIWLTAFIVAVCFTRSQSQDAGQASALIKGGGANGNVNRDGTQINNGGNGSVFNNSSVFIFNSITNRIDSPPSPEPQLRSKPPFSFELRIKDLTPLALPNDQFSLVDPRKMNYPKWSVVIEHRTDEPAIRPDIFINNETTNFAEHVEVELKVSDNLRCSVAPKWQGVGSFHPEFVTYGAVTNKFVTHGSTTNQLMKWACPVSDMNSKNGTILPEFEITVTDTNWISQGLIALTAKAKGFPDTYVSVPIFFVATNDISVAPFIAPNPDH